MLRAAATAFFSNHGGNVNTKNYMAFAAAVAVGGTVAAADLSYKTTAFWTVADMRRELRLEEPASYERFNIDAVRGLFKRAQDEGRALLAGESKAVQDYVRNDLGRGLPPYLQLVLGGIVLEHFSAGEQKANLATFITEMEARQDEHRYECNCCHRRYFGCIDDSVSLLNSGATLPGEPEDTESDLLECGHVYCPACIKVAGGRAKGAMLCLACVEEKEFKS